MPTQDAEAALDRIAETRRPATDSRWTDLGGKDEGRALTALIALAASNVAEIEEARGVARIEFQAFGKIFLRFIETAEVAIGESEEGVGTGGGIDLDQLFEFGDGFIGFARHEKAFAKRGAEIGTLGAILMPDSRRGMASSK